MSFPDWFIMESILYTTSSSSKPYDEIEMTSGAAPVYPLPTSHGNCIIDALLNGVISQNPEAHKHDVMHNMENPSVPVEGYSFSMSPALMMLDFDPSTLLSAINSGTVATPAVYCEPELITARPSRDEDSQLQAIHNPSRDFVQGDCSSHDNISLEKLNPAMELGLIRTTSDSALSTAADSDQDSFNAGYSQLQNGYAGLPSFPILKHTSSLGYREGPGHGHLQTASYNLVVPPDCTMEENITTTKSSIHNTSGLLPHGFNVPESLGINDLVESRDPQSPGPMISGLSSGNNWSSLRAAAGNNIYNEDTSGRTNALREMIYRLSAMQPVNIDLNSITRPKRRNVRISKDPQSVAARHRRERISDRIRILQRLVPGGTKMDTASMLDEAIHYVKFLKRQVQALESTNNKLDPWLINRLGAALSHNTNTDTNNANPNSDTTFTTSCSPLNPNLAASSSTGNSTKTCDLHRAYNSFKQSSI